MKRYLPAVAALMLAFAANAQQNVPWNVQYMVLENYAHKLANCPRKIDVPDLPGYKTLKCDLHIHTNESDGKVEPMMRVTEAWAEGLDVIAITDHQPFLGHTTFKGHKQGYDHNTSYKKALAEARNKGITLIRGFELSSGVNALGHINFIFVPDNNEYHFNFDENIPFELAHEMLVKARGEDIFVTANHPGWPDQDSELSDWLKAQIDEGLIQGMEVFNAYEFYPRAIDHINEYGLTFIGASDSHDPTHFLYETDKVTRPLTLLFATGNSQEEIKEALVNHRSIALAKNILAGTPEWLVKFLTASLDVELVEDRGASLRIRIYNNSDIPYVLDCGDPSKQILVPAHRYCDMTRSKGDLALKYKVLNMFVSSTENLEIPFSLLTTLKGNTPSPYIDADEICAENGIVKVPVKMTSEEAWWTLDGTEPSPTNGRRYTGPIEVDRSCVVKVCNVEDGKTSAPVAFDILYLKADKTKCRKRGLRYNYYSHPEYGSIKSVEHLTADKKRDSGIAARPALLSQYAEKDWFGYEYDGYLFVPEAGFYRLKLDTDDGSRLFLDGQLAIENNYNIGQAISLSNIYLDKGYHSLKLLYFEGHVNEHLHILWKAPGAADFVEIPDECFFYE
ncbi:MAG: PHP domain-containing protein [Bacteroidales bacterium]|nr:PHP domain-containing protein [Bacteroidales bacterium]